MKSIRHTANQGIKDFLEFLLLVRIASRHNPRDISRLVHFHGLKKEEIRLPVLGVVTARGKYDVVALLLLG